MLWYHTIRINNLSKEIKHYSFTLASAIIRLLNAVPWLGAITQMCGMVC